MSIFQEGQKLKAVWGPEESDGVSLGAVVDASEAVHESWRAKNIEVVMESGQMSAVPWALCHMENGRVLKMNLALMERVELFPDDGAARAD